MKLPDSICTPEDLSATLMEIREYSRWYKHELVKHQSGAKVQSTQPVISTVTAEILREKSAQQNVSEQHLDELIEELAKYKRTLPVISITLAAPASGQLKKTLTNWCRQNLATGILVSFAHNRTLLGGMVVRYGSHVYDWSWRRQLLNTPSQFSEVLARV